MQPHAVDAKQFAGRRMSAFGTPSQPMVGESQAAEENTCGNGST
jgi:hypothetical protein